LANLLYFVGPSTVRHGQAADEGDWYGQSKCIENRLKHG